MRILIAASTFPRSAGDDLPRFVLDLSLALQGHGHTVIALVPDADGLPAREQWAGLEVHRFRYFWPRRLQRLAYGAGMSGNLRRHPITWLQPLPYIWRLRAAARALAREARIDVVNSHWLLPQGLGVALARGHQADFQHVATLHGGDAHLLRRLPGGGGLARYTLSPPTRSQNPDHNGTPTGAVLPFHAMLDPRIIRERQDEIVHSCRIRNVKADVNAVLTEQEQTNALLTELNEANRARNTHQKSGQRKMEEAEREARAEGEEHVAEHDLSHGPQRRGDGARREVDELEHVVYVVHKD